MVNAILNGFFNLVIGLVNTLLTPIDNLINTSIPAFGDVLNIFYNFITLITNFIIWVLSYFNMPAGLFLFVFGYLAIKITISHSLHVIKLALAWWRTLKP